MYADTAAFPALAELAVRQAGAVRRNQLATLGISRHHAAHQVAARRWTVWGPHVFLLQNAPPAREQMMWIAVLDAGPFSAVCSHTALELAGFKGFGREAAEIHLLIPRGSRCNPFAGVTVHESRRFSQGDIFAPGGGLPRTRPARSAVDAGAWQRWPRYACGVLAAAVQQRICTPEQLSAALTAAGQIRHRAYMRLALRDISAGAESLGELDIAGMCRRYHLQQPTRQRRRRDSSGRVRYLDCEWELADGTVVVLEIDGSHHLTVEHWEADMRRERAEVIAGSRVLRATINEVRLEESEIVADLKAIGVPTTALRLVSGRARYSARSL